MALTGNAPLSKQLIIMKKENQSPSCFLIAAILCGINCLQAQTAALPGMKMPDIPYKPSIKNGWVGQYVYELHFFDSLYHKNGNYEKRLWMRADNTYSGYIEFPTEVKGAIRSNQPDKYNASRYESWIGSGTHNSWSLINDTIRRTEPIGVMGSISVTGKMESTSICSSNGSWLKGWMNNADMQIDHSTKKYSLAVPVVTFDIDENIYGQETYFNPAKKVPFSRNNKGTKSNFSVVPLKPEGWDFIEDKFDDNQKEIVIRKRIPVSMGMEVDLGTTTKLLTKNGYVDFYLVLKRVALDEKTSGNKPVATNSNPAAEPPQQKAAAKNTDVPASTNKTGLNGLKKKISNIIRNN